MTIAPRTAAAIPKAVAGWPGSARHITGKQRVGQAGRAKCADAGVVAKGIRAVPG